MSRFGAGRGHFVSRFGVTFLCSVRLIPHCRGSSLPACAFTVSCGLESQPTAHVHPLSGDTNEFAPREDACYYQDGVYPTDELTFNADQKYSDQPTVPFPWSVERPQRPAGIRNCMMINVCSEKFHDYPCGHDPFAVETERKLPFVCELPTNPCGTS